YTAVLGRVDAIAFTAGIGENSAPVREQTLADLEHLGVRLDTAANAERSNQVRRISVADSPVAALVVPTNEEWEIAREAVAVAAGWGKPATPAATAYLLRFLNCCTASGRNTAMISAGQITAPAIAWPSIQ